MAVAAFLLPITSGIASAASPAGAAAGDRAAGSGAAGSVAPSAQHQSGVVAIDRDHHSVVLFPLNGRPPRTVASGLGDPLSIVVDARANLYILDGGSHRLLRIDLLNGAQAIVRSNVSDSATMAVDLHDNLYVLDGTAILRYSDWASTKKWIGTAAADGQLTVDGAGHVTVSSQLQNDFSDGVLIQTYPLDGGAPTVREVGPAPLPGGGFSVVGYFIHAVERTDGTMFYELGESGGSGATFIERVPPGSSAHFDVNADFAEYAYTADRRGHFYLMQNRKWCPAESRNDPFHPCIDDYSVDSVFRYSPAIAPAVRPVHDLKLPVGGISVDGSGNIFAAVLISDTATAANGNYQPELVRLGATSSTPTVLALGHYSNPQALVFCVS